jgi:hypothetical protein
MTALFKTYLVRLTYEFLFERSKNITLCAFMLARSAPGDEIEGQHFMPNLKMGPKHERMGVGAILSSTICLSISMKFDLYGVTGLHRQ